MDTYTFTPQRKSAIKKLFGQLFNVKFPSIAKIKKVFKHDSLDFRKKTTWERILNLLVDMLSVNREEKMDFRPVEVVIHEGAVGTTRKVTLEYIDKPKPEAKPIVKHQWVAPYKVENVVPDVNMNLEKWTKHDVFWKSAKEYFKGFTITNEDFLSKSFSLYVVIGTGLGSYVKVCDVSYFGEGIYEVRLQGRVKHENLWRIVYAVYERKYLQVCGLLSW